MEVIKVYVVGGATHYAKWIKNHELVDNIEAADVVMFTGGEDVDPSLYGHRKHRTTYSNLDRDIREKELFNKIDPTKQLAIGICRGSQFLCVMNGGWLVQHCEGHGISSTHQIEVTMPDREQYLCDITSTHHQMQYPFNIPNKYWTPIAKCHGRRSPMYEGDNLDIPPYEPEIVFYKKPNLPRSLAIQGHPEIMRPEAPVIDILNKIVERCLVELR